MAKKKTTIDDLKETFEKVRPYLSGDARLLPMSGDESKCVLVVGSGCQTYGCAALKGHIAFVLSSVAEAGVEPMPPQTEPLEVSAGHTGRASDRRACEKGN